MVMLTLSQAKYLIIVTIDYYMYDIVSAVAIASLCHVNNLLSCIYTNVLLVYFYTVSSLTQYKYLMTIGCLY